MKKFNSIASTFEMEKRSEKANEFYNAILDPYEHPWLVTDEASLYDITLDDDDELLSKIKKYYGVSIDKKKLQMPFWQLLDLLDSNI